MNFEASKAEGISLCFFVIKLQCKCMCVLEKQFFYYLFNGIYIFVLRTEKTMEGFFSFDVLKATGDSHTSSFQWWKKY